MHIEITKATRVDTPVLRRLYELYSYDFSVYTHADVNPDGAYTDTRFLTGYWPNPNWTSFLVRVEHHLAGFVWVMDTSLFQPEDVERLEETAEGSRFLKETRFLESPHHLIEEFFVMRKYRLTGVGEFVAHQVFDQFPGVWEVSEMVENTPAQAFWRKVIGRYTHDRYIEVTLDTEQWHGPVQVFQSGSTNESTN
jgi:predicted acetyltransferase